MKLLWPRLLAFGAALLLAGCAHRPVVQAEPARLLHDDLFPPPAVRPDPAAVFALSPAMREFADAFLARGSAVRDRRRDLIDALYKPGRLRLAYDGELTRTAGEAFDARAGNCLSLVIMTAAFARHLEIPAQIQSVRVDQSYTRTGDITFAAGHVNVQLGRPALNDSLESAWMTVDFLPQTELRGQRVEPIDDGTVIAMYMNNRAAESLAAGLVGQSYWWAREALRADARFLPAVNTLGVIYSRAGRPAEAEAALRHVLEREPENSSAMINLSKLLKREGRLAEAAELDKRIEQVQPYPPFWFSDRAREALARGQFEEGRELLLRELRRQPYQHEVHFLLAVAYTGLKQAAAATRHMAQALENSHTRQQAALYSGKLALLKGQRVQ